MKESRLWQSDSFFFFDSGRRADSKEGEPTRAELENESRMYPSQLEGNRADSKIADKHITGSFLLSFLSQIKSNSSIPTLNG